LTLDSLFYGMTHLPTHLVNNTFVQYLKKSTFLKSSTQDKCGIGVAAYWKLRKSLIQPQLWTGQVSAWSVQHCWRAV